MLKIISALPIVCLDFRAALWAYIKCLNSVYLEASCTSFT